jgi:hypothetical protein
MKRGVLIVTDFLFAPKLSESLAILGITPVRQCLQFGYKTRKFLLPIVKRRRWCNDKKRSPYFVSLCEVRQ